CLQDVQLPLTL
nr:immunoglobulin light chain junction region [Macaca mulatta]